jgi:uncharacterized protein
MAESTGGTAHEVVVRDVPAASRYEARMGDALAGFLDYRLEEGRVVLVHTEVDDELEGHGIGSRLIEVALDAAADARLLVVPECPFVRTYVARHPERLDLVDQEWRAKIG